MFGLGGGACDTRGAAAYPDRENLRAANDVWGGHRRDVCVVLDRARYRRCAERCGPEPVSSRGPLAWRRLHARCRVRVGGVHARGRVRALERERRRPKRRRDRRRLRRDRGATLRRRAGVRDPSRLRGSCLHGRAVSRASARRRRHERRRVRRRLRWHTCTLVRGRTHVPHGARLREPRVRRRAVRRATRRPRSERRRERRRLWRLGFARVRGRAKVPRRRGLRLGLVSRSSLRGADGERWCHERRRERCRLRWPSRTGLQRRRALHRRRGLPLSGLRRGRSLLPCPELRASCRRRDLRARRGRERRCRPRELLRHGARAGLAHTPRQVRRHCGAYAHVPRGGLRKCPRARA